MPSCLVLEIDKQIMGKLDYLTAVVTQLTDSVNFLVKGQTTKRIVERHEEFLLPLETLEEMHSLEAGISVMEKRDGNVKSNDKMDALVS